ncbi:MAG: hypothetical protein E7H57_13965 [Pantoea sp.]|nr:hypothetical protein [Pantoea sp.]
MPSFQLHIKDHPEYAFTGNYFIEQPAGEDASPRSHFEILKATQPAEAFEELTQGDTVTFVSASGEAEEMLLMSETPSHIMFISRD